MKHETQIQLLIYRTHEQYAPFQSAIQILMHYFKDKNRPHPFEFVYFLNPITDDFCELITIFNRYSPVNPIPMKDLVNNFSISLPAVNFSIYESISDELKPRR